MLTYENFLRKSEKHKPLQFNRKRTGSELVMSRLADLEKVKFSKKPWNCEHEEDIL